MRFSTPAANRYDSADTEVQETISSSFAAATVFAFAVSRKRAAIAWALASLVAFSRIYIGVHYPLDVGAGALCGVLIGLLVTGGRAWYIGGSSTASHLVPR